MPINPRLRKNNKGFHGGEKSLIKKKIRLFSFVGKEGLSKIKNAPLQQRTSDCRIDTAWASFATSGGTAMKKYMLTTAMVLALAVPGMAWSQSAPGGGGNGAPPPSAGAGAGAGGSGGGQEREQRFQEHKTEILQRMNEHLNEVQKRIACVQAATNHEALRACMPERREGEGQRGEGHGAMGQGQGHPQ